jgi:hypothetical protein
MNRGIFITNPEDDDSTFYISKWSENIIDEAEKKGIKVIEKKREKANRKEIESIIKSKNPKFLILNGHGDPFTIYGYKLESLIKFDENDYLLKNKITYSIACNAASILGKNCGDNNTSFIGYFNEFIFAYNTNRMANPLKDELAKPFFESTNLVPISIIKGCEVKESVKKCKDSFEKWILHYRLNSELPETTYMIFLLLWNLQNIIFCGSGEMKL